MMMNRSEPSACWSASITSRKPCPKASSTRGCCYRAVLGLEPEDYFVLPDPYGLVRSRAVSNATRTVRFPFNISESRNTATARSVTTYAGAGVHHIAFAARDIFVAARTMAAAGVSILPIPANYYDDIVARFDLPDDLVD